eukprot:5664826-Amphidinium_carterae.1
MAFEESLPPRLVQAPDTLGFFPLLHVHISRCWRGLAKQITPAALAASQGRMQKRVARNQPN